MIRDDGNGGADDPLLVGVAADGALIEKAPIALEAFATSTRGTIDLVAEKLDSDGTP